MATINRNIEQVRKTANQMRADNVTLEDGQLGYESDTRRGKVGPGAYNSLPYKDDLNIAEADVDYAADQRDGGATGGDLATQEYVDTQITQVNQGWNDGDSLLFNDYTAKLALKADAVLPPRIITGNTAYSAGDVFIVNNNTSAHPEYTGPASPVDGQQFKFFSHTADMVFVGNGNNIQGESIDSPSITIAPDSGCELIFSATIGDYLIVSSQGTITT